MHASFLAGVGWYRKRSLHQRDLPARLPGLSCTPPLVEPPQIPAATMSSGPKSRVTLFCSVLPAKELSSWLFVSSPYVPGAGVPFGRAPGTRCPRRRCGKNKRLFPNPNTTDASPPLRHPERRHRSLASAIRYSGHYRRCLPPLLEALRIGLPVHRGRP